MAPPLPPARPSLTLLPAELRTHIFSYLLCHDGVLQRPSTRAADAYPTAELPSSDPSRSDSFSGAGSDKRTPAQVPRHIARSSTPIQNGLLRLSRHLSIEAQDVLYAHNRFRVDYNHLCTCQARYPFTFDHARIRALEIQNFYPRDHGGQTCALCHETGSGLITFLQGLPRLRAAVISLDDLATFSDFYHACTLPASSSEVGSFTLSPGSKTIHVLLPPLQRAWQLNDGQSTTFSGWAMRTAFRKSERDDFIATMLAFLEWEANDQALTAAALRSFFVDTGKGFVALHVPADVQRAAFSAALAQTVGDMFLAADALGDVDWDQGNLSHDMVSLDDYVGNAAMRWVIVEDSDQ